MTYKARLKYIIPLTAITLWVVWVLYEFDDLRVKTIFVTLPSLAVIKISEKFLREYDDEEARASGSDGDAK